MKRYFLTLRARQGIAAIDDYVRRKFGPGVARRVVDRIERACELLAANPSLGHSRRDLTRDPRIRF